jgi:hypothetical protein
VKQRAAWIVSLFIDVVSEPLKPGPEVLFEKRPANLQTEDYAGPTRRHGPALHQGFSRGNEQDRLFGLGKAPWLLPRLVGLARAKQMLLLSEKVSGADAAAWGLIHRCVAAADVDNATEDLLVRLAAGPTVAIGLTKQAIHYGQHATLSQAMNQELFNLELSCRTADFKEGLAAFRDRRTPEFQGR